MMFSTAFGQLAVDGDLGSLTFGSTNFSGDTSSATSEVDYFSGTAPTANWGNEVTFQFELTETTLVSLQSNTLGGDPDFFLLDALTVQTDGNGKVFADSAFNNSFLDGLAPETGPASLLNAGTYYVSAAAFNGFDGGTNSDDATFDIDLLLEQVVAPSAVDLGDLFVASEAFSADTLGSTPDTEIALYDSEGFLLLTNDDEPGGTLQSLIEDPAGLSEGTYYLGVSEFNAVFADGFTTTSSGTSTDAYLLNIGGQTFDGAFTSGEVDYYTFNVTAVPEPTSAMLVVGMIVGLCVRRSRLG